MVVMKLGRNGTDLLCFSTPAVSRFLLNGLMGPPSDHTGSGMNLLALLTGCGISSGEIAFKQRSEPDEADLFALLHSFPRYEPADNPPGYEPGHLIDPEYAVAGIDIADHPLICFGLLAKAGNAERPGLVEYIEDRPGYGCTVYVYTEDRHEDSHLGTRPDLVLF